MAVLVLAASMGACGSGSEAVDTTAADTTAAPAENDPQGRAYTKDNLPADLDLGGKNIGIFGMKVWRNTELDGGGEETCGIQTYPFGRGASECGYGYYRERCGGLEGIRHGDRAECARG